jgi:hypothetical protein
MLPKVPSPISIDLYNLMDGLKSCQFRLNSITLAPSEMQSLGEMNKEQ